MPAPTMQTSACSWDPSGPVRGISTLRRHGELMAGACVGDRLGMEFPGLEKLQASCREDFA
jgi:hypothetical protein